MHEVTIYCVGRHRTVAYAGSELERYLSRLTNRRYRIERRDRFEAADENAIWVGVAGDITEAKVPAVADAVIDDAIAIDADLENGWITGCNPRSVLIAVYRFLKELGCRWVRPGDDGEYLPGRIDEARRVQIGQAAAYRHRGICIEGAVSYEHVRDIIEWAPRAGFNGYFVQFREGHTFFDRWYSGRFNPHQEEREFTAEEARELISRLSDEMAKRDLHYHAVGHGWTCEPFGIPGLGWERHEGEVSPATAKYLALVNGKRELWDGIALNTNLCYSNSRVREMITDDIVAYARSHPEVGYLHLWLADGSNNHCECDDCCKARPADFYVMLLNELDDGLTRHSLETRIVFLIYVDLLWPPEKERIRRNDRFVLMFAPITRTYSSSFAPTGTLPPLKAYERNKLEFPRSVEENLAYLRAWQELFEGDSFVYDYHYMWDHYLDPGGMQLAEVLAQDIRQMARIGLGGLMSCQTQRAFLPSGFGMVLMGEALWNPDLDYAGAMTDYFAAAFGDAGEDCGDYLQELSRLFDPPYIRGEKGLVNPEAAESLDRIPGLIDAFMPTIERNALLADKCRAASWRYLGYHAGLCRALAEVLARDARGNREEADRCWQKLKDSAWRQEEHIHPVFDVWNFTNTYSRLLTRRREML